MGIDPSPALDHFRGYLGWHVAERIVTAVRAELNNPFHFFDAIYCLNLAEESARWKEVCARFDRLGILHRVRRFEALRTQPNHHVGCALSHRAVVEEAKRQGLANVLVFEDDVLFTSDAISSLMTALEELRGRDWRMLYLGACRWRQEFPLLQGATRLAEAGAVTCTHAVAFHHSVFDRILTEVPRSFAGMEEWLRVHHGIDQYFAFHISQGKYLVSPVVATQANILPLESEEVRERLLA